VGVTEWVEIAVLRADHFAAREPQRCVGAVHQLSCAVASGHANPCALATFLAVAKDKDDGLLGCFARDKDRENCADLLGFGYPCAMVLDNIVDR
jgi:hypothetical protein